MRNLCLLFLVLLLVSCKTLNPTTLHNATQSFTTLRQSVDTVVVRDSVFVSERQQGDTIYLTRTDYRDRWRTRLVHDTIRDTQYITQTIEHPPEKYVPKFYRWCTIAFWVIGILAIGYSYLAYKARTIAR